MTTLKEFIMSLLVATDDATVESIIKQAWVEDCEDLFIGLDLATNPIYEYGLQSVPEIQDEDDGDTGTLEFSHFHKVALNLAAGELSPSQVDRVIEDCALTSNIAMWNLWYRRILLKNLHNHLPMTAIQNALLSLTTGGPVLEQNGNPQGD